MTDGLTVESTPLTTTVPSSIKCKRKPLIEEESGRVAEKCVGRFEIDRARNQDFVVKMFDSVPMCYLILTYVLITVGFVLGSLYR